MAKRELDLPPPLKTVQAYYARIKEKLNLRSVTEMVREAVRWSENGHKG